LNHAFNEIVRVMRAFASQNGERWQSRWESGHDLKGVRDAGVAEYERRAPRVHGPAATADSTSDNTVLERECRLRTQTAPAGYSQQDRSTRSVHDAGPLERTSHADRHGRGCPSAPSMQHSAGADLTAAVHR
jgi:hypothetical protein